ncbi:hypothetical protein TRVL_09347 [Trypanosoma vivax]|nr:hypothetical protein TRVL_09347 [Trypanosoma vivax]
MAALPECARPFEVTAKHGIWSRSQTAASDHQNWLRVDEQQRTARTTFGLGVVVETYVSVFSRLTGVANEHANITVMESCCSVTHDLFVKTAHAPDTRVVEMKWRVSCRVPSTAK